MSCSYFEIICGLWPSLVDDVFKIAIKIEVLICVNFKCVCSPETDIWRTSSNLGPVKGIKNIYRMVSTMINHYVNEMFTEEWVIGNKK